MSSDKLSTIKEPLVNVEFDLETEDGNKKTTLEMNKAELKDFIESLEAANKVRNSHLVLHFYSRINCRGKITCNIKFSKFRNDIYIDDHNLDIRSCKSLKLIF